MRGPSRKKQAAIRALLTAPTVDYAAKVAHVSPATLYRWLNDPDFRSSFSDAQRRALAQAVANLQHVAGQAVLTLRRIMGDSDAPTSARVSAARGVLELAFKAHETMIVDERLTAIEAQLGIGPEGES